MSTNLSTQFREGIFRQPSLLRRLLTEGRWPTDFNPFAFATWASSRSALRILAEMGPLTTEHVAGSGALTRAAEFGDGKAVRALLPYSTAEEITNGLQRAVVGLHPDVTVDLLRAGADPATLVPIETDCDGKLHTCLHAGGWWPMTRVPVQHLQHPLLQGVYWDVRPEHGLSFLGTILGSVLSRNLVAYCLAAR